MGDVNVAVTVGRYAVSVTPGEVLGWHEPVVVGLVGVSLLTEDWTGGCPLVGLGANGGG